MLGCFSLCFNHAVLHVQEFGDISETLYTGPILYTSIVQELYYNVLVTSLTVGSVSVDLPCHQVTTSSILIRMSTP